MRRLADASGARARMSEVAGERTRRGATVLRVPDAEAASGDTIPAPKVDGRPWNGCATVPESTVACSRARALHAMALFMCQGRVH